MGTLEELDKNHPHFNNCLQNYIAYFPETQHYIENLDFDLYQLQVERCAYVGGFAAAHEITGNDFRQLNPLDDEACSRIISHMNEDHADALTHYCHTFNINLNGNIPKLVAIDACGFQLRIGQTLSRINFPEPISDRISAREALVAMAQR